jgi:hypothetical protein
MPNFHIRNTHQRNDLGWLRCELVSELLVIGDQVRNVDIAVILFYQDILPKLISIQLMSISLGPSSWG